MPIINCYNSREGKHGYKVENTTGCPFVYETDDEESKKQAYEDAKKQLAAIEIQKHEAGLLFKATSQMRVHAQFALKERAKTGIGGERPLVLYLAKKIANDEFLTPEQVKKLKNLNEHYSVTPGKIADINYRLLGGEHTQNWV